MRRGIITTSDELRALRLRISKKPFDGFFDALQQRCALILESAPLTEMNWQAAYASGCCGAAITAARGVQGRILDLLIADGLDPNSAYRSRALEELRNLVRWSTWVDPSRADLLVDRCTAEAAVAAIIGLDMLWDDIRPDERQKIIDVLHSRVIAPYLQSISDNAWWFTSINHWNGVINSACGMVGLALGDDSDEAHEAHLLSRQGLHYFFADLGREGGWDEGLGFWGYAIRYVLLYGEACSRLIDDQKILHYRGMDVTGRFPIYFSPNGRPASFGDSADLPLHGSLYLLGKYFDNDDITWWLDEYSFRHDVTTMDWSKAGLAILYRPDEATPPVPRLETLKVFHQIGWAAMADDWPRPKFYVAAKTGDLATSHSQHDMNSLQVQIDGEMLLRDIGNPPDDSSGYFSDKRSRFYEVQARAHNTIIVAEEDHRPDARGEICHCETTDAYHWLVCNGGEACGEDVRFMRHVIMLRGVNGDGVSTLVVLDELDLGAPERVDLFWHTGGEIEFDAKKMTGQIVGRQAGINFALSATTPAEMTAGKHKLIYQRNDNYLQLSGGMIGRNLLASVFSRDKLNQIELLNNEDAVATLKFNDTTLTLSPCKNKKFLQIESVK